MTAKYGLIIYFTDIDECSKAVDYCHHQCLNTAGGYRCTCRFGYDLLFDGKTCIGN
jgi:hypothetical protein